MVELSDSHIDYERRYEHPSGETYTQRMQETSRRVIIGLAALIVIYFLALALGLIPMAHQDQPGAPAQVESSAADSPLDP